LSRRREEIEGGIRRTIDLNRMWRKFGWSTRFNQEWEPVPITITAKARRPWSSIKLLLHQSMEFPASCLRHGIGHQPNV
jgi:hypothetical protein